jgi:predicted naringenin-chalcone synthase
MWSEFFAEHFAGSRVARRIFASAGVQQRHAVADPRKEDLSGWSTGARIERYAAEAMPLGEAAVAGALDDAGLAPRDVGLLTVVSCTGYATPGIDIRLAQSLGMADSVQRLFVGHMAVLLCLELTSLHIQPPTRDIQQVVAHALFSDAAVAVVVEPGVPGLTVVDVAARTDVATADHMTWEITDLGFRMGLSPRVPDVLAVHVGPMVADLLARNGVRADEVDGWAVHPGGPRILDVVADRLALPDGALDASREVLAEHGNCSSATVLLVLARLARPARGRYVVALAFGPGLTLYAALLRQD